jgi:hypothetical protein
MRHSLVKAAVAAAVLVTWLASAPNAQAQFFGSGDGYRALRPGANIPYDGAGYSHRYNYEAMPYFIGGYDSEQIRYLDYLDRLDRAEKFGHRWPSARKGSDYQFNRIHREYWLFGR